MKSTSKLLDLGSDVGSDVGHLGISFWAERDIEGGAEDGLFEGYSKI